MMRTLDAAAVQAATPWLELIAAIAGALAEDAVTAQSVTCIRSVCPAAAPGRCC